MKIRTTAQPVAIAVTAVIIVAALLAGFFPVQGKISALLTSGAIILVAGELVALFAANKRPRATKFERAAMPNARVLIVDDMPTNLDVAKALLKPYGMQVDCISSGIEAIERIRNPKGSYDAIFMDHMMPQMDGIEATRIIREEIDSDYAREIPIIALTANADADNEKMYLEKGFQALLGKPINVMKMDALLRQWVRGRQWEQKDEPCAAPASLHNAETQQEPGNAGQADEEEIPRIEGLNWQAGLNYFSGNRDAYLSVIRSYIDDTARLVTQICSVTEETLADYAILVHGIKGSSYGIEAREIGKQAEELEHAAKAGNFQAVSQNTPFFVENTQKFLGALSSLLKPDAPDIKPVRHAPDETLLDRMGEAAADFKIDEMEEIMKSLERFKYETQAELIIWLRGKVNQMEFSAITEWLAQRKQKVTGDKK